MFALVARSTHKNLHELSKKSGERLDHKSYLSANDEGGMPCFKRPVVFRAAMVSCRQTGAENHILLSSVALQGRPRHGGLSSRIIL